MHFGLMGKIQHQVITRTNADLLIVDWDFRNKLKINCFDVIFLKPEHVAEQTI